MANVLSTETKLERANEEIKSLKSEIKSLKDSRRGAEYALKRKDKEIETLKQRIQELEGMDIVGRQRNTELCAANVELKNKVTAMKSHPTKAREKEYNFILKWRTNPNGRTISRTTFDTMFNIIDSLPEEERHNIKPCSFDLNIEDAMHALTDYMKCCGLDFIKSYDAHVRGTVQHVAYFHFKGSSEACGIMKKGIGAFIGSLKLDPYAEIVCEENTTKDDSDRNDR